MSPPDRGILYPFVSRGQAPPITIARSEGAWLVTSDGKRILDAAGGAIVCNVGHGRAELADVARDALAAVDYLVPPLAQRATSRLAERLRGH